MGDVSIYTIASSLIYFLQADSVDAQPAPWTATASIQQ